MQPVESFPGTVRRGADENELLHAVRDLVVADRAMRHDLAHRMHLGETDLRAIRFVMSRVRAGVPAAPRDVAAHLGITTAATTTLLDRLVAAGHVRREAHPTDRRSKVVVPTDHAWAEAHRELAPAHDRMREVAAAVPAQHRAAVVAFLRAMTAAMDEDVTGR